MSSGKQKKINKDFASRFAEACGSSEAAVIQRLLSISNQAARNYLTGRIPDARVLMIIAERTPYSIHWLLTGRGKKIADEIMLADTPLPTREAEAFVRRICVEVINEIEVRKNKAQPKTVVLRSREFYTEKVMDESTAISKKQP